VYSAPRLCKKGQLLALVSSEFGDGSSARSAGQKRLGGRRWRGVAVVNGGLEIGASLRGSDPGSRGTSTVVSRNQATLLKTERVAYECSKSNNQFIPCLLSLNTLQYNGAGHFEDLGVHRR
jgi:hypothetical protein